MTSSGRDRESHDADRSSATGQGSITGLFSQLKGCDPAALGEVWKRFFPRMTGLARKTLDGMPRCGVDADDVAQGAFISFWRALDGGAEFEFGDRNDLWKLLGVITVRKSRKFARRQLAKKRGGGRIQLESELLGRAADETPAASPLNQAAAELPPADFDLVCEEMLLALDDEHRAVAILRLQGYSSQEIGLRIDCSPRSVQRKLKAIRAQWETTVLVD
jgi:RNA polymerase sigma factor (sigma-70 family)